MYNKALDITQAKYNIRLGRRIARLHRHLGQRLVKFLATHSNLLQVSYQIYPSNLSRTSNI